MAHKQYRPPVFFAHILHLAQAFALKLRITNGQYLIYDQNFGFEMGGYGESQPHVHAR